VLDILGIDPGLKGAFALLYNDGNKLTTYRVPTTRSTYGRGLDLEWERLVQSDALKEIYGNADAAFIERVSNRPREGGSSSFKFGKIVGGLHVMLLAWGYSPYYVIPRRWKVHFGLSRDKQESVTLACKMFPDNIKDFYGPRGGALDGVAEAALIARYGYEMLTDEE
jgi:hypothetical protein